MKSSVWMWPSTLQCHMPKTAPSDPSLDTLQAQNTSFMHKSMIADKRRATDTRQHKESALSTCVACHCCCRVSVARRLSAVTLWSSVLMAKIAQDQKDLRWFLTFGMGRLGLKITCDWQMEGEEWEANAANSLPTTTTWTWRPPSRSVASRLFMCKQSLRAKDIWPCRKTTWSCRQT